MKSSHPSVPCAVLWCTVLWFAAVLLTGQRANADDAKYRTKFAAAVRAAAERVLPSVVTIEIIGTAGQSGGEVEQDAPTSGIVIDEAGYIVASSIVVRRPSASVLVVLPDRTRHPAKVVARDNHRDLVLLKIKTDKKLSVADLPDDPELVIGQSTIAVGRYGNDVVPMVSTGILSAVDRLDGIALQTDARVGPALYGGPLIDLKGELLGVLIPAVAPGGAPDSTSWYDSGIAFAIPANILKRKLDRLRDGKDIDKGLIGIVPKSQDPYADGTELGAVRVRSPAESAGLKAGDVVVSLAGKPVRRFQEIRQVLGSYDAGEVLPLEYERDGKRSVAEIELAKTIPPLQPQWLGIVAREDPTDEEGKAEVVVDAVVPASSVDGKLQTDDVIVQVAGAVIDDVDSLRRQMISAEPDKPVTIVYRRGEEEDELSVTPSSIAGPFRSEVPDSWKEPTENDWEVSPLKLPDVSNAAAYVGPKADEAAGQLGLLVLLLKPGQNNPEDILKSWPAMARNAGVVVCAIAPQTSQRWQPKEIEDVARIAGAVIKKVPIDEKSVAVAAAGALADGKAEAADSMALAVAVSESKTFFGVAISDKAKPPAVRLRENDAAAGLQVMVPIGEDDDLPAWGAALQQVGYPIVRGGQVDGPTLLRWTRLLQTI